MPKRVSVDLHRCRVGWQGTRPNDRDGYSFRESQTPVSNRESSCGKPECRECPFDRFEPWSSPSFGLERLFKSHRVSPQHLLLRDLRALAQPCELSASFRQQFGQTDQRRAVSNLLLVDGFVPEEPATTPFRFKRLDRLRSGTKPIGVTHHLDHTFDGIRRPVGRQGRRVNGVSNVNALFEHSDPLRLQRVSDSPSVAGWCRARWERLRTRDPESGEGGGIAFLMLGAAIALLMVLGLVLDGSAKAHALDRANQLAYEAARAGLQTVNPSVSGVDHVAVDAAVGKYLAAQGVSGSVVIADQQVVVEVTITEPTKLLSMVGIDSMTVTGHGTANLVYGQ